MMTVVVLLSFVFCVSPLHSSFSLIWFTHKLLSCINREKARVQSSAKYAGNNQDATFEIELIGWQEVVSVGTEGGISKVIIQQGEGYQTPNAVCVTWIYALGSPTLY